MADEESKLTTSALMGLVGFLATHLFMRLSKKNDDQDGLAADVKVLQSSVERLEEDLRETKRDLYEHLRDTRRPYDDQR